jgi:hypothetical protein
VGRPIQALNAPAARDPPSIYKPVPGKTRQAEQALGPSKGAPKPESSFGFSSRPASGHVLFKKLDARGITGETPPGFERPAPKRNRAPTWPGRFALRSVERVGALKLQAMRVGSGRSWAVAIWLGRTSPSVGLAPWLPAQRLGPTANVRPPHSASRGDVKLVAFSCQMIVSHCHSVRYLTASLDSTGSTDT